jgi:hypothetical protein
MPEMLDHFNFPRKLCAVTAIGSQDHRSGNPEKVNGMWDERVGFAVALLPPQGLRRPDKIGA